MLGDSLEGFDRVCSFERPLVSNASSGRRDFVKALEGLFGRCIVGGGQVETRAMVEGENSSVGAFTFKIV